MTPVAFAPLGRALLSLRSLLANHPDAVSLTAITALAFFFRGQLLFRAPMFMQHDSAGYLLPAYDLYSGQGFGVGFRRTPIYPLFLTASLVSLGESLAGILVIQHLLGAATAALTYLLGRATFGRLAGLIGGLLVAVNGALLIGEHYLMSEAVFIPLVLLSLLVLMRAGRGQAAGPYVVAGGLLALTALCRPIAQALYPLVPFGLLLLGQRGRRLFRATAFVAVGVLALTLPWLARNCLTSGECSTTGVVGQALLARTAYYDHGFVFFDPDDPQRGVDAPRPAIRRSIQRASEQSSSGGVIARRLQSEFKWTDAETSRMAREMALDVIRRQPLYYLSGTLQMFGQIAWGEFERLRTDWKTQSRRMSRDEWDDRIQHFLTAPTPQQEAEFERAESLVNFWQPAFWQPWLPLLSIVGLAVAARARGPARGALLPGAAAVLLMFVAAALDGPVARYRYPADPIIGLMAAGGAIGLAGRAISAARRVVGRGDGEARGPVLRHLGLGRADPGLGTLDHGSI